MSTSTGAVPRTVNRGPRDTWYLPYSLIDSGLGHTVSQHLKPVTTIGHPFVCGCLSVHLGDNLLNTASVSLIG